MLNNKNADTWMYFSLLCLLGGPHRVEEAEQSLFQALRLGFTFSTRYNDDDVVKSAYT